MIFLFKDNVYTWMQPLQVYFKYLHYLCNNNDIIIARRLWQKNVLHAIVNNVGQFYRKNVLK